MLTVCAGPWMPWWRKPPAADGIHAPGDLGAGHSWQDMEPHITTLDVDGVSVRLLDLAGLLKTKQGLRPKDQMDAALLSAALGQINK